MINIYKKPWFKNIALLIGYWFLFICIPFFVAKNNNNISDHSAVIILLYIIFISPFLVIIPYKLAKFKKPLEKPFFVLIGLTTPLIYIYILIKAFLGMKFGGIIML